MSQEQILEEFWYRLDLCTETAVCGRQFVLVEKLQAWLRSSCSTVATYADRLLRVAYRNRPNSNFQPVTSDIFKPGYNCCLLVFCILQLLKCGSAIQTFSVCQKVDRLLPMRQETINEMFRNADIHDQDIPSKFFELQYRFTPAKFELHTTNRWDRHTVIPIQEKNPIKEGGTAQLYQIDIPEEFVGEAMRRVCAGSRFNEASTESPDWVCYLPHWFSERSYPWFQALSIDAGS